MRVSVVSVSGKPAAWMQQGVEEYVRRLKPRIRLELVDLKAESRTSGKPIDAVLKAEADRIRARLPTGATLIALDERGVQRSTRELAERLAEWQRTGEQVAFVIGGPDGLHDEVRSAARELWSLSRMTLPHGLARLVLLEQVYRACTLLEGHPYHRE
ncbi:MAG: 23S rRNA (pseudouridine(1915)-N(3))-methyltransferase RlmH [Planctomyces sp.]|nr:23S rRNA (pseudouridine(1915)-N(3))-methyltransferase RlmH [Planctomyces sp.]